MTSRSRDACHRPRRFHWQALPLVSFLVSEWRLWRAEQTRPCYTLAPMAEHVCTGGDGKHRGYEGRGEHVCTEDDGKHRSHGGLSSELLPYPLDMWPLLSLPKGPLDEAGVPLYTMTGSGLPGGYYPTLIAQYALARWNAYLATGEAQHRESFLIQAEWLATHETRLSADTGGWPFTISLPDYSAEAPWLSALIQGNVISVLIRAYQLSGKENFLQVARRAVRAFELDIRDGGVSATIGEDGVFFEEVAAYPAAHILNGYIFSLFGLYDYVTLTGDEQVDALIRRSVATLHTIIDQYDAGYWSRYDLRHKYLASHFYHDQHAVLLHALARYTGCEHCVALAQRWQRCEQSRLCRLWYFIVSRSVRYWQAMRRRGFRGVYARLWGRREMA